MKSPITGKEMKLHVEKVTETFRKEQFEVTHLSYLCDETGEQFEPEDMADINLLQVYNQYRAKYNLPFPEEIKATREKYKLPASKMAEVLGFGVNVYRAYESGEVPSESNARLIQLAQDPEEFRKLVRLSAAFQEEEESKLITLLDRMINKGEQNFELTKYMLGLPKADIYTGYRVPNLEKFNQMVLYFTEALQPYKTKLNKLLFYADFLHFKQTCYSISGTRYQAIQMGPVPKNFNTLFEYAHNSNYVTIWTTEFNNGIGEQFKPSKEQFKPQLFNETELAVLDKVAKKFNKTSTQAMIDLSHEEEAWDCNKEGFGEISYEYGFKLKHV